MLIGAFFIILMNLIVDIVYAFLDPRVQVLTAMPLLEVKDLKVHFDTDDGIVKAVDGISYSVDRGQTLGIVGESGSGKSRLVADGDGPDALRATRRISGSIMFDGKDLLDASDEDLRRLRGNEVAMIFQDPLSSLHPFYKVGDADRRGGPRPPRRVQGAGAGTARSRCSASSASPSRASASTPTRTSSPAACASA